MAGYFELINAPEGGYQLRLRGGEGEIIALSVRYPTKQAAAAGVSQTREFAASGLIRDLSSERVGNSGPEAAAEARN
jgi:uncharacterized protein YegP (UPF0339 family)